MKSKVFEKSWPDAMRLSAKETTSGCAIDVVLRVQRGRIGRAASKRRFFQSVPLWRAAARCRFLQGGCLSGQDVSRSLKKASKRSSARWLYAA